MMKLPQSFLSWLLWKANAHARKQVAFYRLKDDLLHAYGTLLPETDIQQMHKECWSCYGSGLFTHYSGGRSICNKCDGSGIWDTHFIELERWELAGRIFHRPIHHGYGWTPDGREVTIRGLIQHRHTSRECATECRLWLFLLFDRSAFRWQMIHNAVLYGQPIWYPLSACQRMLWLRRHQYRPFSFHGGQCEICFKKKFWRSERLCFSCAYERAWHAAYELDMVKREDSHEYCSPLPLDDDVPF